jgi:hypothetical protein
VIALDCFAGIVLIEAIALDYFAGIVLIEAIALDYFAGIVLFLPSENSPLSPCGPAQLLPISITSALCWPLGPWRWNC